MKPGTAAAKLWAIVPAAGSGERFRAASKVALVKQYAPLLGKPLIYWPLQTLLGETRISSVTVAISQSDADWLRVAKEFFRFAMSDDPTTAAGVVDAPRLATVAGGDSRARSVLNALVHLHGFADERDWVLVHDAARPCLSAADLAHLIDALGEAGEDSRAGDGNAPAACDGALLATPVADTLKRSSDGIATETVDRNQLWRALTPQAFRYGALRAALQAALQRGETPTDEAQAMEAVGVRARLIAGSALNIKVTVAEDLAMASRILGGKSEDSMRTGQGFDVHAFGPGNCVMLGGVRIPHTQGVVAHSDGDVVIHALCDAILGALGKGDIGMHFPDNDPSLRGADSRSFLKHVAGLMTAGGFCIGNADVTVLAQAPRVAAHRPAMIEALAHDLRCEPGRLNIKATTTERLGFIGREEGLAASAVVCLRRADSA